MDIIPPGWQEKGILVLPRRQSPVRAMTAAGARPHAGARKEDAMPDVLDIFVFVCWFAGGFVSGVSGIGGTMFAFPFLALAIPMHALIPLSCLVCFFKDACMIAMHVRFCRFDAMPWLLVVVDDVRESLAPLHRLRIYILLFVGLGAVLVTVGAFLGTRYIVSCLTAADRKQAHIDARMLQSSKMAALGKMAAGVAHEVNNPLMLIQENAGWIRDLLQDENPKNMVNYDEIMESTDKIEKHVQRAKGITQRMLGFGRRMNPGRSEIMVNVLVDQATEFLKTEARGRNIAIEKDFSADVPVILSDSAQLEQVFINIIDNAIDAIGKNGSITVRTEPWEDGARIYFKDTGPGMDEETMQRIFDPFFTTKAVGEGTGLGLAICFTILEKLGGRIEVSSVVGQGTTFCISLPAEPPSQPLETSEDA